MKKHNDTVFTVQEQFKIMLIFLVLSIIIVTIAYCSVYAVQSNNASDTLLQSSVSETTSDNSYTQQSEIIPESSINEETGKEESKQENSEESSELVSDNSEEKAELQENREYALSVYSKSTDEEVHHIENFPSLCQWPELPTGCESVSLTSVLNYFGFDISMTELVDNYLPINNDMVQLGDFHYEFLGNPYEYSGFGCLAPCIEKTAYNYFNDNNIQNYISADITGAAPQELYNLIAQDIPVVVWVTTGWVEPYIESSWQVSGGETVYWPFPEHCLVLTGYDKSENTVTVSNVDCGYEYTVSMPTFESVYEGMGSNAVVILEK